MNSIVVNYDRDLERLRDRLALCQAKLVLVESCTAGIIAGLLGQIPGISAYFCGSLVVYRNESKRQWLGIDAQLLDDPRIGPVSPIVTRELAQRGLRRTPEATIAAAITGHLGPNAPPDLDGCVFTCIARRRETVTFSDQSYRLKSAAPQGVDDWEKRQQRQLEAASLLVAELCRVLIP